MQPCLTADDARTLASIAAVVSIEFFCILPVDVASQHAPNFFLPVYDTHGMPCHGLMGQHQVDHFDDVYRYAFEGTEAGYARMVPLPFLGQRLTSIFLLNQSLTPMRRVHGRRRRCRFSPGVYPCGSYEVLAVAAVAAVARHFMTEAKTVVTPADAMPPPLPEAPRRVETCFVELTRRKIRKSCDVVA